MNSIWVGFYSPPLRNWRHKIVAWWTKSPLVHSELILPGGITAGICPEGEGVVRMVQEDHSEREYWKKIELKVDDYQLKNMFRFYEQTAGQKYDWIGMVISQFVPYMIKHDRKWYCSQWIAHALITAGIFPVTYEKISPGRLHEMVLNVAAQQALDEDLCNSESSQV